MHQAFSATTKSQEIMEELFSLNPSFCVRLFSHIPSSINHWYTYPNIFPPHATITLMSHKKWWWWPGLCTAHMWNIRMEWKQEIMRCAVKHMYAQPHTFTTTHTERKRERETERCSRIPCQTLSLWVRGEFIKQDGLELQWGPECRGSSVALSPDHHNLTSRTRVKVRWSKNNQILSMDSQCGATATFHGFSMTSIQRRLSFCTYAKRLCAHYFLLC